MSETECTVGHLVEDFYHRHGVYVDIRFDNQELTLTPIEAITPKAIEEATERKQELLDDARMNWWVFMSARIRDDLRPDLPPTEDLDTDLAFKSMHEQWQEARKEFFFGHMDMADALGILCGEWSRMVKTHGKKL